MVSNKLLSFSCAFHRSTNTVHAVEQASISYRNCLSALSPLTQTNCIPMESKVNEPQSCFVRLWLMTQTGTLRDCE